MKAVKQLKLYEFNDSVINELPIVKPIMDEGWFCKLSIGSIIVRYNYKDYVIEATEGNPVCFLVVDGNDFTIESVSDQFDLIVVSVHHNVLSEVYPYLGSEANMSIAIDFLISTHEMNKNLSDLINQSLVHLKMLSASLDFLIETDSTVRQLIIYCMFLFHNGIKEWKQKQNHILGERLDLDSHTQSYKLMSRLFDIFNDPDSFCHRDAKYFSDRLNISARYFYQVCVKETGMTPKDFINDVILSEIKHTLLTTSFSFQQISHKFGFSDQSGFTQYFRRNVGVTPSEFRAQHK